MSDLIINQAKQSEIPIIHQLASEIWHAYYPAIISIAQINYMLNKMYSAAALHQQLQEGHQFYIASEDDQPVGYFSFSEKENGDFFLHKLYIKMTEHRKGIGSSLFHYLLTLLPSVHELRLTVNRKNYKAINFYFKQGFMIEEAKDFDIGEGYVMNDFVMVRKKHQV